MTDGYREYRSEVKGLRIAGITAGVPHVARSVSCHAVQQAKKGFSMSATAPPSTAASFPQLGQKVWIFAIIRGVLMIIFGLIALLAPVLPQSYWRS